MHKDKNNHRKFALVSLSVERRVAITMLMLIVMVFGLLSLSRLSLDMLPDVTFPVVTVVTHYEGCAPEEMEQMITVPLEGAIAGINGVKRIRSECAEGMATVFVEFEWGTNLDYAAQDIKDRIEAIGEFFPDDMRDPVLLKFNLSQIPVMFVGVSGPYPPFELKELLEDEVRERLQRLDGVAQAAVLGEESREIRVALNPAKLKYRNVGLNSVIMALRSHNLNTPAGYFEEGNTDFLLRAIGQFNSIEEIGDVIVGPSAGMAGSATDRPVVCLRDVAEIKDTLREARSRTRMNGKESVFLVINKRSGSNTLRVTKRVIAELREINKLYPDLSFVELLNQGGTVERVTKATTANAIMGGILAIVFMLVFLLNVRPTLVIAVAIPLSIVATFIAVFLAGHTLNLMTLGGLALGVGMLVDNAIVVIESIYRHLENGTPRKEAAKRGGSEVALAITASTFTTVAVFLPIMFSKGMASQLFRGVALTVVFSLLSSLFVALTIVPMLASVIFREHRNRSSTEWFRPIRNWYARRLKWCLDHPAVSVLIAVLAFVSSLAAGGVFLGREFIPQIDRNRFVVKIELPVGTTLDETTRLCGQIRSAVLKHPHVVAVGEIIGRSQSQQGGNGEMATGPNSAEIVVRIGEADGERKTGREIQEEVRRLLPPLRGSKVSFSSMSVASGGGKPVTINIYGKDLATLSDITGNVKGAIASVPGLRDIETSFSHGRPEYHFVVKKRKAVSYGLAPVEIQRALEIANLGKIATQLRTGEDEIDVRVILDKQFRDDLDEITDLPIQTRMGSVVPLRQVVSVRKGEGPTVIKRDGKSRVATVDANLAGTDLGTAVEEIRGRLTGIERALPPGYSIEFKGEFENMRETFGQLLLGLLIAILLVYMVMASQFESFAHPFVIMTTVPLSIIGVAWILIALGKTFSVVAFIGVIVLAGIVVNNGIVLVDCVNHLRRGGMAMREALIEAGKIRIRPVLITAGTTIMGMLPMALSRSEGSELRSPMALTVIGGLLSGTALTLLVVPVVYELVDGFAEGFKKKVKKLVH